VREVFTREKHMQLSPEEAQELLAREGQHVKQRLYHVIEDSEGHLVLLSIQDWEGPLSFSAGGRDVLRALALGEEVDEDTLRHLVSVA
jgi:hypothetical protein